VDDKVFDMPLEETHKKLWRILTDFTKEMIMVKGTNLVYVNYDQVTTSPNCLPWERLQTFIDIEESDVNYDLIVLFRECVIGVC